MDKKEMQEKLLRLTGLIGQMVVADNLSDRADLGVACTTIATSLYLDLKSETLGDIDVPDFMKVEA